jgi:hypothetical protein
MGLYIKSGIHFGHISLTAENEMFQTKIVEKVKTHILCSNTLF